MLDIDLEKAAKLIEEETQSSPPMAMVIANQLTTVHKDLCSVVDAWLNGEQPEFMFRDITLSYIREKESSTYINAIFTMSVLIENPDMIERYKDRVFQKR